MKIKHKNEIEIMSPAGDFSSMMSALNAGADSVYFGIEGLNMRAKSSNNFTIDDLEEIASRCKEYSANSYLTVNTVIYNDDLELMRKIIDSAKNVGITAVIGADQAVIGYCHSAGMPLHISTQANISNIEAIKFYSMFSDVMVLARELSLEQISEISHEIKKQNITGPSGELIRLEVFVHGALCMAISGKCYLSLHHTTKSANRGECTQQCRKAYTVKEKGSDTEFEIDNQYIMSPKDLCTIEFIDEILKAGASVLKIEGRGRSPEYVKRTTECYREAVDLYLKGEYTDENKLRLKAKLEEVFNRGFWGNYYLGGKLGEWTDKPGSKAGKKKVYLGKVTNYFAKIGVAEFKIESQNLEQNTEVLIIGPTTGTLETIAKDIRDADLKSVEIVGRGDVFTFAVNGKVRKNDELYKLVPAGQIPEKRYTLNARTN
jgi:U32 family peptidase